MIDFNEGTLRVSVGYSLKIPNEVEYASQEAHVGFSYETQVTGASSFEEVEDQALQLEAELASSAKLAVFAQLAIDFDTVDGVLVPKLVRPARMGGEKKAGAQRRSRSNGGQRRPQGGGGRYGGSQSKAAGRNLDVVEIGGIEYYDQRPLKEDGTYAQGAADFKSTTKVDGRFAQLWILDKDGELNDGVADLLDEAGVDY